MALSILLGVPGSGKSYEAVSSVILPAYQTGRSIITNIKGIDPNYWQDNVEIPKGGTRGTITVVDELFFQNELNYPLMSREGQAVEEGHIPAGALVVIDEAYLVFPTGAGAVTARMNEYVRTHRHFVAEDGTASDIVLISQDVMALNSRVRGVAEFVTRLRNMRHLGLSARYRADVFTNWKMGKNDQIGSSQRKYKKEIFKLYKSFQAEGTAKVVMTDKSHRALKWYHLLFLFSALCALVYSVTRISGARNALSAKGVTVAATARKPDCNGSGVLVDLTDRRVFTSGNWRPINGTFVGADKHTRWDVGPCNIRFGEGTPS